ncbi:MAG: hypothetical protein FD160_1732 [Caulobacteraceae bacterium]|nr:MAG: hypothetical protein FD160_1732 [Caulobacteraceae bacterium]
MIEPRRRSPLKRGAGAACTEGRNGVKDGQRAVAGRVRALRAPIDGGGWSLGEAAVVARSFRLRV